MFIKDSNGNSFEYSEGNAYGSGASYVGANRSMEPQLIFPDAFRRMP